MGIEGTLMACWTILLIWALRKHIQRRFVILLTALVVLGMALELKIVQPVCLPGFSHACPFQQYFPFGQSDNCKESG